MIALTKSIVRYMKSALSDSEEEENEEDDANNREQGTQRNTTADVPGDYGKNEENQPISLQSISNNHR